MHPFLLTRKKFAFKFKVIKMDGILFVCYRERNMYNGK